jgi:hypothetical protein
MLDFVNNDFVLNQRGKKRKYRKMWHVDMIKWLGQRTHNQELVGTNHAIHWGNGHCYIEKKKKEQNNKHSNKTSPTSKMFVFLENSSGEQKFPPLS